MISITNSRKRLAFLLECLHPVMIFSLIVPVIYTFILERDAEQLLRFFLCSLIVFLPSLVIRTAAGKSPSAFLYLLICLPAGAGTLFLSWQIGRFVLSRVFSVVYLLFTGVFCLIQMTESFLVRIRDYERRKAMEDHDISWTDRTYFLEKPVPAAVIWFILGYFSGVVTACPVLCDIALITGLLYLLLALIYMHMEMTDKYLKDTSALANVPGKRIRRLETGMLTVFLILLVCSGIPAFMTMGSRKYADIRNMKGKYVLSEEELKEMPLIMPDNSFHTFQEEFFGEEQEVREPPAWLEPLIQIIAAAFFIAGLAGLVLALREYFREFRDGLQENGDIAESLSGDEGTGLVPVRRRFLTPLSEKEKIRRKYRRTIRRYRKGLPESAETPEEIEERAAFPEGFDRERLHQDYEKARYGK